MCTHALKELSRGDGEEIYCFGVHFLSCFILKVIIEKISKFIRYDFSSYTRTEGWEAKHLFVTVNFC